MPNNQIFNNGGMLRNPNSDTKSTNGWIIPSNQNRLNFLNNIKQYAANLKQQLMSLQSRSNALAQRINKATQGQKPRMNAGNRPMTPKMNNRG